METTELEAVVYALLEEVTAERASTSLTTLLRRRS